MANVRDYLKQKEKRSHIKAVSAKAGKQVSLSQKIRKHRAAIFYRTSIILAVTLSIILLFYLQWKNKVYVSYIVNTTVERTYLSGSKCMNYNGKILTSSTDGISCADAKGNVVWNQTYEMQKPVVSISGDKVAVGDYNGRTIYVMDMQGSVGEIDTNLPIRQLCISDNGVVAAVLDDTNVTWIYLYSSTGEKIAYFKTTMEKSGYPVTVDISPDGTVAAISYLYVDSGVMRSTVAFYNFGEIGKNSIDNLVSSFETPDAVIPVLAYMDADTILALGDSQLSIYTGNQRPVKLKDIPLDQEVQGIYYNQEYIAIVYNNTTGSSIYRVDVYNTSGNLVDSQETNIEYKEIIFHKDLMIIYNEAECLAADMSGKIKYEGSFEKPVLLMIPMNTIDKYILVTQESVDTIVLK